MTGLMIEAVDVSRTFGAVTALDSVTLRVPKGSVAGLLGHNGAGKTTLINILTTLLRPDRGTVRVAGFDVLTQGPEVRRRVGLTGQLAAVDDQLSGTDNLVLVARLLGATRREARTRAGELVELFDLTGAAGRPVHTWSGGMRRRLDLAASLVGQPEVIVLDEPTTGLDPVSRRAVWDIVEALVRGGATVLLTTQYLDEADRLADSITVLSSGKVAASGTPAQLKAGVGQRTAHLTLVAPADAPKLVAALEHAGLHPIYDDAKQELNVPARGRADLAVVVRTLDELSVEVAELTLTDPTLDDVYLSLSRNLAATAA